MPPMLVRAASLAVAVAACSHSSLARSQSQATAWMDQPKLAAWNQPDRGIVKAPQDAGSLGARCGTLARPPESTQDKSLREAGWDLVGAYQGGWQVLVIAAAGGYDGMCRPRQYQHFVFVRGGFVGTLSPQLMDSRTDGALSRVFIEGAGRITAEYLRYRANDALCCPSRTTSVVFEISKDPAPVVRPVSASTRAN